MDNYAANANRESVVRLCEGTTFSEREGEGSEVSEFSEVDSGVDIEFGDWSNSDPSSVVVLRFFESQEGESPTPPRSHSIIFFLRVVIPTLNSSSSSKIPSPPPSSYPFIPSGDFINISEPKLEPTRAKFELILSLLALGVDEQTEGACGGRRFGGPSSASELWEGDMMNARGGAHEMGGGCKSTALLFHDLGCILQMTLGVYSSGPTYQYYPSIDTASRVEEWRVDEGEEWWVDEGMAPARNWNRRHLIEKQTKPLSHRTGGGGGMKDGWVDEGEEWVDDRWVGGTSQSGSLEPWWWWWWWWWF
ncbi:hypothetical protein F5879DRAFT_921763 [Lentinula edodes]|nr:hypothetical protein F5879DRAFT_921763 [Lentinula edodes]